MSLYDSLVLSKILYAFETYDKVWQNAMKGQRVVQKIFGILQFEDRKYLSNAIDKECNILKRTNLYEFKLLEFTHNVH